MIEIIGPALNQWDAGRSVKITDTEADKAHLANKGDSIAVIMDIVDTEAKIPDFLLHTGKQLCVYAVKDGITLESKIFYVNHRERPENYVYEDDQRNYIYQLASNAEAAVEAANTAAEKANRAAAGAKSAYELAVAEGYEGTVREWLQSLVGQQGIPGKQGPAGADGATVEEVLAEIGTLPMVMKDPESSVSEQANAVGPGCVAGAKAYQIIDKGATDTPVNGSDGYYLLCADEVPIEELTGQDYSITIQSTYELAGKIVGVGQIETGLTGIDENGNHVSGLSGFKVYVTGYKNDVLLDNTSQHWNETRNTFRIPDLPRLGTKDYGKGAWAEGFNTQSVSIGSHAEGDTTKALGKYAHVQNADNMALYCGHAEGRYNEARGNIAHAQGLHTKALGTASHSAGTYTVAAGDYSHAGGMFTQANYEAQTVFGRYNRNKSDTLFEVGVGSGDLDRANGFEVKEDGSARVLTESTEPDAVVRYSQLERTAVGFTNVVDTAISIDFEEDTVGQTPVGWTEKQENLYPEKHYARVEDDAGNKVFHVHNDNVTPGTEGFMESFMVQRTFEEVSNVDVEYRFKYVNESNTYELFLPSVNYTGTDRSTDTNDKKASPLKLYLGTGHKLRYKFGAADAVTSDKLILSTHTWYTVKMSIDLRAGTRSLFVGADPNNLTEIVRTTTADTDVDWTTATLNRISMGNLCQYGGDIYVDDIKLSWERKSETCALTYVEDGELHQLYPATKAEAIKGLDDYIKNRMFWIGEKLDTILSEQYVSTNDFVLRLAAAGGLLDATDYIVTLDGVQYQCTSTVSSNTSNLSLFYTCLGDTRLNDNILNTNPVDVPFLITSYYRDTVTPPDYCFEFKFPDNKQHTVKIERLTGEPEYHPLDENFLPVVPVSKGGTGATTATEARTALGAHPGVESAEYTGCYYRTVNGVVEWINPPMEWGVEYRTTERFNGKPVYTKCIDLGTLPSTGFKEVNTGLDHRTITVIEDRYQIHNDGFHASLPYLLPTGEICIRAHVSNSGCIDIYRFAGLDITISGEAFLKYVYN